jgi:hypothetical protein
VIKRLLLLLLLTGMWLTWRNDHKPRAMKQLSHASLRDRFVIDDGRCLIAKESSMFYAPCDRASHVIVEELH